MKKLLILLLFLTSCTPQIIYRDRFIAPPADPMPAVVAPTPAPVPPPAPEPIHKSLTGLGKASADSIVKSFMIKQYLKKNPKAWVTVKYESMFGLSVGTCQNVGLDGPDTEDYGYASPLLDKRIKNHPHYVTLRCTAFVGIRSLIEYNLIEDGVPRVVVGSTLTRRMLSIERHFQMKHASIKTTHPPGHVAGSSLMVTIAINSHGAGAFRTYADGIEDGGVNRHPNPLEHKCYVRVEVLRVGNNELMYSHIFVLDRGRYRSRYAPH